MLLSALLGCPVLAVERALNRVGAFGAVMVLDARWVGNEQHAGAHGVGWEVWWELVSHGTSTGVLAGRSRRPRISGKQGSSLGPGKLVLLSGSGGGCDSVNQGSAHVIPAV